MGQTCEVHRGTHSEVVGVQFNAWRGPWGGQKLSQASQSPMCIFQVFQVTNCEEVFSKGGVFFGVVFSAFGFLALWLLGFLASRLLGFLALAFRIRCFRWFMRLLAAFGGFGFSHPLLSQFLSGLFGFLHPGFWQRLTCTPI